MPSVTYSSSKPSAPESITILTSGNYTVPAGKSAKISAICNGSATVSLNGTQVLNGATWDAMRVNSSPVTITGGTNSVNAYPTLSTAGIRYNADYFNIPASGTGNGGYSSNNSFAFIRNDTWTNSTAQSALSASYTVPAGTVIATSGGRCVIEIYSA